MEVHVDGAKAEAMGDRWTNNVTWSPIVRISPFEPMESGADIVKRQSYGKLAFRKH